MRFSKIFGNACYITAQDTKTYPYFRKEFIVNDEIVKAQLTVSILGFGEIYCNGSKVNNDLYITPYSQYNEQCKNDVNDVFRNDSYFNEEHGYSIYTAKYDITDNVNILNKGLHQYLMQQELVQQQLLTVATV